MSPNTYQLLPVANATASCWRKEPHSLDEHRSTSELPKRSDIVIIGAGFTGATAAYYLLNDSQEPRPSVTLLEAREACSGATGGHLRPDGFVQVAHHIRQYGFVVANEIAQFEVANAEAVTRLIGQEGIECDLRSCTTGHVYLDDKEAEQAKQQYDEMLDLCPTVNKATYHGPSEAEQLTSVEGAKAAFTFPAATVSPYKMVMGLLERAVQNGLNLQTNTPVLQVSDETDSEGFWSVSTPRGVAKARQVIYATNAYTSGVLPQYQGHIVPVRGMMGKVSLIEKPGSAGPLLHSSVTAYPNFGYDYHAVQPDGSLVIGGAFAPYREHPSRYNVVDDSTLYEDTDDLFEGWVQKSFKGWENAETKVDNIWTGIMGYTQDKLPHVGRVPGRLGQFVCAGFNGHGMPNVLLCARAIVQMIQKDCSFSDTGVPAGYETSISRLQVEHK